MNEVLSYPLTPVCWEYAKDSKIKTDEISRISSNYKTTQNSTRNHYCYVFLKVAPRVEKTEIFGKS